MSFTWYPVKNKQGTDIHLEGMARITIDGEEFTAGRFMPWVFRLGLGQAFDRAVIMGAVKALASHKERLHVNLSTDSVRDESFTAWLKDYLAARDEEIARLGFELSESAVLTAKERFGALVSLITPFGCQVGVEHMGYRPEIIAELGRLGPSYLKIDSLYTQDLQTNEGNRAVVSSLSGVAKSLGIDCIVEGISTGEDRDLAFDLGAKGASGRAIG
jgi:EAL domain-containing protein (putative c-di-GMP-specific phosphodiesterase class I)